MFSHSVGRGTVRHNDANADAHRIVGGGQRLEVQARVQGTAHGGRASALASAPPPVRLEVVYEDDHLAVVVKPPGMPVQVLLICNTTPSWVVCHIPKERFQRSCDRLQASRHLSNAFPPWSTLKQALSCHVALLPSIATQARELENGALCQLPFPAGCSAR